MSPQRAGRRSELRREAARLRDQAKRWADLYDVTELEQRADQLDQAAHTKGTR
ncbi:hypothetical protein [Polymorphospora lycopeni]|uniref:Uncharacterized protein n=1 Tax=Polymorphospora lycopeni TaxID=3140240 RepID=A0ABV5CL04_9ACTN